MSKGRIAVIVVLAALVVAFVWFDLGRYLNLEYLKARQADIDAFYREHPVICARGLLRCLCRDYRTVLARRRHHDPGRRRGVRSCCGERSSCRSHRRSAPPSPSSCRDTSCARGSSAGTETACRRSTPGSNATEAFYLFTMRLVPAFPFFVINLVMGLTPDANVHVRMGQPGRDAAGNHRVRECRHAARTPRFAAGNPVARPHRLLRAPGNLSRWLPSGSVGAVQARRRCPAGRTAGA